MPGLGSKGLLNGTSSLRNPILKNAGIQYRPDSRRGKLGSVLFSEEELLKEKSPRDSPLMGKGNQYRSGYLPPRPESSLERSRPITPSFGLFLHESDLDRAGETSDGAEPEVEAEAPVEEVAIREADGFRFPEVFTIKQVPPASDVYHL